MFDFKEGNKPFGDWLTQLGLGIIAGAVVGIAANLWVGAYALVAGGLIFVLGTRYQRPKRKRSRLKKQ